MRCRRREGREGGRGEGKEGGREGEAEKQIRIPEKVHPHLGCSLLFLLPFLLFFPFSVWEEGKEKGKENEFFFLFVIL